MPKVTSENAVYSIQNADLRERPRKTITLWTKLVFSTNIYSKTTFNR